MGFSGDFVEEWDAYIFHLKMVGITLTANDNKLSWNEASLR